MFTTHIGQQQLYTDRHYREHWMLILLIQYTNKQSVVLKDRLFLMMLLVCRSVRLIVISLDDAAQNWAVSSIPRGRLDEVVVLLVQPEHVRLRSFGATGGVEQLHRSAISRNGRTTLAPSIPK
jgi:hypothetical protein